MKPRVVRAPRGTTLTARSWQTEAALRMLMNNLDPEVAERPADLVVYGGIGRAARDWESYDRIVAALVHDLELASGDRVAVLVNGMGATPLEELYVLYRRVYQILAGLGVQVSKNYIGEYATSLEMAGASISLLKLDDARLSLLQAPASSPFFKEA